MTTSKPDPVKIEFGVNYPNEKCLQTGDVVFPRVPKVDALPPACAQRLPLLLGVIGHLRLADYIAQPLTLPTSLAVMGNIRVSAAACDLQVDEARIRLIVAIAQAEFPDLMREWFNVTVLEFMNSPLAEVLFNMLIGNVQDGFFIGHCGLVIRETDGAHDNNGTVYVVEANATSFDHYGVAARPYYVAQDSPGTGRYRSWAGFRASRGDFAWSSRHPFFDAVDPATAGAVRNMILTAAKPYIGRSYSFFDTPTYADPDALYCSEFVYRVFDDVINGKHNPPQPLLAPVGDDTRSWLWMKQNNPSKQPNDLGDAIQKAWDHAKMGPYIRWRTFFILTVQMLWRSAQMMPTFKPGNEPYDDS